MTKAECKRRMTHAEYLDWQAYHKIEPFGVLQERLGFAYLCSIVANALRGADTRAFSGEDFFPELAPEKPKTTNWDSTENQILLAKMWVLDHGGKVIEGEHG